MSLPSFVFGLLATFGIAATPALAADSPKAALSDSQREKLTALVAEFRTAVRPEQRLELIAQADKLGPTAVDALLAIVNAELRGPLADYRRQFTRAAAESAAVPDAAAVQEIATIRAKVLALSKDEVLTEKQIVEIGDPGLLRLQELLVPRPADVVRRHPKLRTSRQQLLALGKQWEKCATLIMLAEDPPAADPPVSDPPASQTCADAAAEALELELPSFANYLDKEEELAAALAMPLDAAARQTLSANASLAAKIDAEEARCVLDLNLTRVLLGLPPLRLDPALAAAARGHSADMQLHEFFAHESPLPGKKMPWDRAKIHSTTANAENIAVGTIDGAVVNAMLWHSPSHHKNLVGDFARIGAGRHGKYWTELFGR